METLATVVSDRGDEQNVVSFAESNGAGQDLVRLAPWCPLTAAYVDQVRAFLHCSFDRPGKVQLGEVTLLVVLEYGENETPAPGGDPADRSARLSEDQAGHVGPVGRHRSRGGCVPDQSVQAGDIGVPETGMREVDGPVEYGDAYFRVAQRLGLE
jgi:hypothetical protein